MKQELVVVAGGTGNLGGRIARELIGNGARVRALVRRGGGAEDREALRQAGAEIAEVDYASPRELAAACSDASCVVSALAGLHEVIVEAQTALLEAAVAARVPRFIPSDYSIDFTRQPDGWNRNLDLRRQFHQRLDAAPIAATSVFCGAFADLLTGQAPIVIRGMKRVLYWEDADQPMDFTTIDDVAAFTAAAALDPHSPRFLRIAGDEVSARDLCRIASSLTGERFRLLRAGGLRRLRAIIRIARTLFPGSRELYPPWQGMQYLHNMFSGLPKLHPLDNERYPGLQWTTTREVLAAHLASA